MSDQNPYGDKPSGDNPNSGRPEYGDRPGYGSGPAYGGGPAYGETVGYGQTPAYAYPQQPPPPPPPVPEIEHPPTMLGGDWQHSAPAVHGGGGSATLLTVGDIAVMSDKIMTPAGVMPLRGAVWTVSDMSRTEENTPTYAIVLAVIFFFACLLGLLFMLIKERRTTGYVQVTVHSGGRYHATMIPARGPNDAFMINQQVNHARSLCA